MANKEIYYVYRHYNSQKDVIYIGCTSCMLTRTNQHKTNAPWYCDIDCIRYEEFKNKEEAINREKELIKHFSPVHNRQHNENQPDLKDFSFSKFVKIDVSDDFSHYIKDAKQKSGIRSDSELLRFLIKNYVSK